MVTYPQLDNKSWNEVVSATAFEAHLPYSVHAPINFPGSQKLTFCDCAMNVYSLETPSLNTSIEADRAIAANLHVDLVSFAFGDVPFVPDFRQVKLSRKFGGLPIMRADFTAWDIVYLTDYCMGTDGTLHVKMTVRNESFAAKKATVWVRPTKPLESKVFDYHYISFTWDARRWLPDDSYLFRDNAFHLSCARGFSPAFCLHDRVQGLCGLVTPNRFTPEWVKEADFTGQNPNANFLWGTPYRVFPEYQLEHVTHVLKLEIQLEPQQEEAFELSFDFSRDSASLKGLHTPYDKVEKAAIRKWRALLKDKPVLQTGDERENSAIEAIRLNDLQLLMQMSDGTLRPCQGGSSERFYVWVWEAMCAVSPLIWLGHFEEARRVIEFVFSLQDGGCPPSGEFTTTSGAVGTSGPKWANTTGAALILAGEYLRCAQDETFKECFLEKMLKAGHWILGEIRATRRSDAPNYGVMPPACASDGDFGQLVFTDAWSLAGLMALRDALQAIGHPEYETFRQECDIYKQCIDKALDSRRQPDGFLNRSYGDNARVCHEFRFTDTPFDCCTANVSTATEPRMSGFLRWMEKYAFRGLFCSEVTHGIYYIGNNELAITRMYLELGKWKRAWAASKVFRRFAITPDLFLTQERFSATDAGFTAWQPNASNDGRYLELQICRMFHCVPGKVILFGAYAPFELEHNPSMHGVYTRYGKTDLSYHNGTITLRTELPIPKGTVIQTQNGKRTLTHSTKQLMWAIPVLRAAH